MPTAPSSSAGTPLDHRSSLNKSISRMIQHSILQLCNEHIGYSHKLQILGVLCMTVDDEQQEIVVKVNNTLKRVNPAGGQKDGPRAYVSPTPSQTQSSLAFNDVMNLSGGTLDHLKTSLTSAPPTATISMATMPSMPHQFDLFSPIKPSAAHHAATNGRKNHGRKGANPVKVQHVIDEGEFISSEEDHDNIVTVIPTDPDSTALDMTPLSESSPKTTTSPLAGSKAPMTDEPKQLQGSARRKPHCQYRVTNGSENGADDTPATIRALLLAGPRSKPSNDSLRPDTPLSFQGTPAEEDEGEDSKMSVAASPSPPTHGLSLPVVVEPKEEESYDSSINRNVDGALDFSTRRTENGTSDSHNEKEAQAMRESSMDLSMGKDEFASPNSPRNLHLRSFLMRDSSAFHDPSYDRFHLPIPGLSYPPPPPSLPGMSSDDGLSIRYTSTGPITVNSHGKSVCQSPMTKMKDIIMYDDSSPPANQKGSRIETGDYMLDSLGYENSSRKRRRRAPDESLTSEEIAEYIGFSSNMAHGIFKCRFCDEEVQELTRYLQHTLSKHNAYICHQCGKSFTTKSSLLRHRPIHTGMRRFACSICKKTFYRKDKCKAHIKRHLGVASDNANVENYPKVEAVE